MAQIWCVPGVAVEKGKTSLLNIPFWSAVTEPTTLLESLSQSRVMFSLGRNSWPVTVTLVSSGPNVGCRPRVALVGVGVGTGVGLGVGDGVGVIAGELVGGGVCGVVVAGGVVAGGLVGGGV